jgi:hypothetical protein
LGNVDSAGDDDGIGVGGNEEDGDGVSGGCGARAFTTLGDGGGTDANGAEGIGRHKVDSVGIDNPGAIETGGIGGGTFDTARCGGVGIDVDADESWDGGDGHERRINEYPSSWRIISRFPIRPFEGLALIFRKALHVSSSTSSDAIAAMLFLSRALTPAGQRCNDAPMSATAAMARPKDT